jgi:uncharacterized membrane protein (Fun14 family)
MSAEAFTSISATVGGGFVGGLLLGYALKKVVKLMAAVIGLFIAGLAHQQYQQIAYFDWDKIERALTTISGNVASQISTSQDISSFAFANIGIPLTSGMSTDGSDSVACDTTMYVVQVLAGSVGCNTLVYVIPPRSVPSRVRVEPPAAITLTVSRSISCSLVYRVSGMLYLLLNKTELYTLT